MAAPKSRLSSIRSDLERDFVKPKQLTDLSRPAPLELPSAHAYPHAGQVIIDLPNVGPTAMEAIEVVDPSRPEASPVTVMAPKPDTRLGTNPAKLSQRHVPAIIERLIQHALSDDYRASIPACNILLERAYGKARQAEPEAEQSAIDMSSLPVRDRIKALLEARGNAGAEPKPVVGPQPFDPPPPEPILDTTIL